MNFTFSSTIQSFRALMPKAYFLYRSDMDIKEVQVTVNGQVHPVTITVEYRGVDSIITAQIGDSLVYFERNPYGGVDVKVDGEPLPEGVVNEIVMEMVKALEN